MFGEHPRQQVFIVCPHGLVLSRSPRRFPNPLTVAARETAIFLEGPGFRLDESIVAKFVPAFARPAEQTEPWAVR